MTLPARQIAILVGENDWLDEQVQSFFSSDELYQRALVLNVENFSKAKNLLGREFEFILYDARNAG